MIVVPSVPAQGLGSTEAPGLEAMREPDEYEALQFEEGEQKHQRFTHEISSFLKYVGR